MNWQAPAPLLRILCVGWLCFFPLSAAESAKLPPENERLQLYLESLQGGELEPLEARNQCISRIYRTRGSETLRELVAGFLQQPETNAFVILCEALIEAVNRGDLMTETVVEAMQGEDDLAQANALGRFLRIVYFIHYQEPDSPPSGAVQ